MGHKKNSKMERTPSFILPPQEEMKITCLGVLDKETTDSSSHREELSFVVSNAKANSTNHSQTEGKIHEEFPELLIVHFSLAIFLKKIMREKKQKQKQKQKRRKTVKKSQREKNILADGENNEHQLHKNESQQGTNLLHGVKWLES